MQALNTSVSLESFFKKFSEGPRRILFLDYDGTLAPFTIQRDRAHPYDGVVERLNVLTASQATRLVIVSGRTLDDLRKLLKLKKYPELWGSHGAERYDPASNKTEVVMDSVAKAALEDARQWVKSVDLARYCETKPTGLAFHWRGLPDNEQKRIKEEIIDKWSKADPEQNLALHDFDGGIELRYYGVNKGKAVEAVLHEVSVSSPIAYLGDDLTDEDAFAALGDKALKILVREKPRQTLADARITPPAELLEFLDRWIEADK